ncbi:sigma-70 family RNA polymerase sigma factor [Streptomyces somaliensis]|uniref:sigma-70 family RNA polymerase sigma factor n=1 Tax=Streptomyces somaliensis TaxID=78355 RepID=UPI0034E9353D|nr:sigma-70 family RNA polymerase sigma factor [Streptomyces somaliensis]
MGPPSDAELLRRLRGDDDAAYRELFRRHSEAVRRYARTYCRDRHAADDLTAEAFTRTLQAVRRGGGPEEAVRAHLLAAVRQAADAWARTARRERLVGDFVVFAVEAAWASAGGGAAESVADVLAVREAGRAPSVRAFRSLPERWQAVLWHTVVEGEPPHEVAPLFGLTAGAAAALADRALEGLGRACLQAHVDRALTAGGDCARYADRLGAYARGGPRARAGRGLRGHLEGCAGCRSAVGELARADAGLPVLLPVAVVGWIAAGYSFRAGGAGGAAGGDADATVLPGVAGAVAAGAVVPAGAASGGPDAPGAVADTAASDTAAGGPGAAARARAGVAVLLAVAAAGLGWVLAGDLGPVPGPEGRPPVARSAVSPPAEPPPWSSAPRPPHPPRTGPGPVPASVPEPGSEPLPEPEALPEPARTPAPAKAAGAAGPAPPPWGRLRPPWGPHRPPTRRRSQVPVPTRPPSRPRLPSGPRHRRPSRSRTGWGG